MNWLRQLRHAARLLRKTPGFTATALVTLAVCLGANLTIFAVVDSILLRPLPFPEAGRLVTVFNTYPKAGVDRDGSSITNYYERRGRIPAFAAWPSIRYGTAIVGEAGSTQREPVARVSPEFFATLGAGPVMGRSFTEEETSFRNDKVAILTDAYWRQHFDADPHVIGKQIRVDGLPHHRGRRPAARLSLPLVGSAPLLPVLVAPGRSRPRAAAFGRQFKHLIARLKPGATLARRRPRSTRRIPRSKRTIPRAR